MSTDKTTGWLFISGAIAILIPYTLLTIVFEYPDVLRQDTAVILIKFHSGGNKLIGIWLAFALTGLPLIPAFVLMGQALETKSVLMRTATTIGVIGLIVQVIALLRWVLVVPALADNFVASHDEATRTAVIISFKTLHQFAGVLLGEFVGQLFTIGWTIMLTYVLSKQRLIPAWQSWMGYISGFIYLLGISELFQTVMPGFPVLSWAGFAGSTLWLVWVIVLGVRMINGRMKFS